MPTVGADSKLEAHSGEVVVVVEELDEPLPPSFERLRVLLRDFAGMPDAGLPADLDAELTANIAGRAKTDFGIQVQCARIKQLNYPAQNKQAVFRRMEAERERIILLFTKGTIDEAKALEVASYRAQKSKEEGLAATRKVTDRGWLPRSRQIGITGRAVTPPPSTRSSLPTSGLPR